MTPELATSYKGRFPFRLGTTSYIYPRGYVANIQRLGPLLDEIELLFFESRPDAWPSPAQVDEMAGLAQTFALGYHIHLPLDLRLGHPAAQERTAAVETVARLFALATPLSPVTWTLHLALDADPGDTAAVAAWRQRILGSLRQLIASGIPPRVLSLENLDYPIEWIYDLSQQTDCRMCLDVGHLLVGGGDASASYARFREKIDVIHLHGVRNGRDHLSLDVFDSRARAWIPRMLDTFTGSLSLEVFSHESLVRSLHYLEKLWKKTH